jgi:hypothetical protein
MMPPQHWRSYGGRVELLTGIDGVSRRPVRRIVLLSC